LRPGNANPVRTREATRFERKFLAGFMLACVLVWGLVAVVVCAGTTLDGRTSYNPAGMVIALFGFVWMGALTVLAFMSLLDGRPSRPPTP